MPEQSIATIGLIHSEILQASPIPFRTRTESSTLLQSKAGGIFSSEEYSTRDHILLTVVGKDL